MSPEQWLMARRVPGARDVRSLFALNNVVLQEDATEPTRVTVDINVDMGRLQELMESVQGTMEKAGEQASTLVGEFVLAVEDMADDLESDLEEPAENAVEALNEVGDFVKSTMTDSTTVEFSLAQKEPARQKKQSSKNGDYAKTAAGVTFGVIALASVAALVHNRKKTTQAHEESLL